MGRILKAQMGWRTIRMAARRRRSGAYSAVIAGAVVVEVESNVSPARRLHDVRMHTCTCQMAVMLYWSAAAKASAWVRLEALLLMRLSCRVSHAVAAMSTGSNVVPSDNAITQVSQHACPPLAVRRRASSHREGDPGRIPPVLLALQAGSHTPHLRARNNIDG